VGEFALSSGAFTHGGEIPRRHACEGEDVSPALFWSYFFRLHALDAELEVGFRAGRRELERALAGHVLATAELMGTFER
jgi:phosphatidylethanolamine-binding protein (PEBP) family uncharacterized protein